MGAHPIVKLAREVLESEFTKRRIKKEEYAKEHKELLEKRGVFVTITKDGELRGCIGYTEPIGPLYKSVILAARGAAFDDPRFPPLQAEELGAIRIEVSVLTEPKIINVKSPEEYLKKIRVGKDGLIIKQGFRQGLLLPQVPVEYGWNVETFLEHLCLKAGLPRDSWKNPKSTIKSFQAEIYREEE